MPSLSSQSTKRRSWSTVPHPHPHKAAQNLPNRYRKTLLEFLPCIHKAYKSGDVCPLHDVMRRNPESGVRWKPIFKAYGVPWVEWWEERFVPVKTARKICASGETGTARMITDLQRLGPYFDSNRLENPEDLAREVKDLKASCKKLEYLLRTNSSSPTLRSRAGKLLESIQTSPALDLDLLEGVDNCTQLYLEFCALSLTGEDTREKMRNLRQLVNDELDKAIERVERFDSISKIYDEGGREDLAAILRANVKAAD
ncbi:hypothetical protein FB451DRAFT_105016 [Mycena latifolia]|nr:hypothetical protein FB451DRAFT_105016 [Mycena latifolia]